MEPLVTPQAVAKYLKLTNAALTELEDVTNAVIALIVSYKGIPAPGTQWGDDIKLGATMLAARIYRRRNSPAGVESLGELGPVYVSRNDPDLAQLLKLGRYATPQVG